jgi:hypothetical protein
MWGQYFAFRLRCLSDNQLQKATGISVSAWNVRIRTFYLKYFYTRIIIYGDVSELFKSISIINLQQSEFLLAEIAYGIGN